MIKFYKDKYFGEDIDLTNLSFVNSDMTLDEQIKEYQDKGYDVTKDDLVSILPIKEVETAPVILDSDNENEAEYIETLESLNADFSKRKSLEEIFDKEDADNLRNVFQFMSIEEFSRLSLEMRNKLNYEVQMIQAKAMAKAIYQSQTGSGMKLREDFIIYTQSKDIQQKVVPVDLISLLNEASRRESQEEVEQVAVSLLYEFNRINHKMAKKAQMTYWGWEEEKYKKKYEAQANQAWAEQESSGMIDSIMTGGNGLTYLSSMFKDDYDKDFTDNEQKKADDLFDRFMKLRPLKDNESQIRRSLAFNYLIENRHFDDAENVCKLYEQMNDDFNSLMTKDSTNEDEIYDNAIPKLNEE